MENDKLINRMVKASGWIDEERTDGVKYYTRAQAVRKIKSILRHDDDLLNSLCIKDIKKLTDNRIIVIGSTFYGIYKHN